MRRNRNIVNTSVAGRRRSIARVKTERCSSLWKIHMDLKIKLLEFSEGSPYLIVIAKGEIDGKALKRVFNEIEKTSRALLHCKVFIDLEEASLNVRPPAIHSMASQFELHLTSKPIKMAVIGSNYDCCGRLDLLRDLLCSRGFRVALFDNTTSAAAWLSREM